MYMVIAGACLGFSVAVLTMRFLPSAAAVKRFFRRRKEIPRPVNTAALREQKTAEKEWSNFLAYTGDKQAKIEIEL